MNVILKLTSGLGVTHKSKPDECFLKGVCVKPSDDLQDIREKAAVWLPYKKGPECLDKGHGWALNHPIQKLIEYKNHLLGVEPEKKKRKREDPMEPQLAQLKKRFDDGEITSEEYHSKISEILSSV